MSSLHRASEAIDNLKSVIDRHQDNSISMDAKTQTAEQSKKTIAGGVPKAVGEAAEVAVSAIFEALESPTGLIRPRIARQPPEWWSDMGTFLRQQRPKSPQAHAALLNAFNILDRHVSENRDKLTGMVFLAGSLDDKIEYTVSRASWGSSGDPNANKGGLPIFAFYQEVEAEVGDPLYELHRKVFENGESCVEFLRDVLDEIEISD